MLTTTTGQAGTGSFPEPLSHDGRGRATDWLGQCGRKAGQAVRMGTRRGRFPEAVATETTLCPSVKGSADELVLRGSPGSRPQYRTLLVPAGGTRMAGLRKEPTEVQPLGKKPQSPGILSSATIAETWGASPGLRWPDAGADSQSRARAGHSLSRHSGC